ncbi:hypothetical protein P5V15_005955 [Pogonomyrmex californicus]
MSHTSFTFLVIIGVLCSMKVISAPLNPIFESNEYNICPPNQVWNTCGTACPPTCTSPKPKTCSLDCVIECQCKYGYVLNSSGVCVLPSEC